MSSFTITETAALNSLLRKYEELSPDLAAACKRIGASMRGRYLKIAAALESDDYIEAGSTASEIVDSEVVTGLTAQFYHLRERIMTLRDELGPWAKVVFGLTMGAAGYFLAPEIGIVLGAILMVGGFLYAIAQAKEVIYRKGMERALGNDL